MTKTNQEEAKEFAEIVITPNPRSKNLCYFIVKVDGWRDLVKFPSTRKWLQDLFIRFVYRDGKFKGLSANREELYPPDIHFLYPKDKLIILSALTSLTGKHRRKLEKLLKSGKMEEFEEEIITLGIAEDLGRDD